MDENTREFVMAPFHRSFTLTRCRAVLFAGGTLLSTCGPLNPEAVVQAIQRHHGNALSIAPSVFVSLFGRQEALLQRVAPQIRNVELGGAAMLAAQKEHIAALFPNAIVTMPYGLTEAPRTACLEFAEGRARLASAGRATSYAQIAVVDDDGLPCAAGVTGDVLVRGTHVMLGYWRDPARTAAAMRPDGWFRTGDRGTLGADGYLTLAGRSDGLISMDGATISPAEIEERIREFFPAYEFCIVGLPDPAGILGEIPVLCYVPRDGKTITPSELSRLLADRIDRNKIPRIVYRIDPPAQGRLRRDDVRARLLALFSQEAV
jgi:long-chain acyl-CoA synthetase